MNCQILAGSGSCVRSRILRIACLLTLALATTLIAAQTPPSKIDITAQRLSPRAAVFYGGPWDNGILALATQKGIVVVDAPFSKTFATAFRNAIQAEFKRSDFVCLINSHEHNDHVGGNAAYADLPIIGHESLRREMLKSANDPQRVAKLQGIGERDLAKVREYVRINEPKELGSPEFANYEHSWQIIQADYNANPIVVPPTVTFDSQMTLYFGDISMRLTYYGFAHSVADTIISIPEENLVFIGGILSPNSLPIVSKDIDEATATATVPALHNWFVVMHNVLNDANETTRFMGAHGRFFYPKERVRKSVAYLEDLWKKVQRAKASGQTLAQAKNQIPLRDFPDVAKLPNHALLGTEWAIADIHQQNIEQMWKVLAG